MPFVIRYPKEIPAGTRNSDIVLNVDFAALLADYARVNAPDKSQGVSFRDNLKGETPNDWRKVMYYRYWTHHRIRPAHMGVRDERYKLMFLYGDPLGLKGSDKEPSTPAWEFYDLKNDPYEDRNQYQNPKYADIIEKLKIKMCKLKNKINDKDNLKINQ